MKFLIDANLPFKLAKALRIKGFDILHTDNLPDKERTTDKEIRKISVEQDRIVITKDSDFLDSHVIQGVPAKLLLVHQLPVAAAVVFGGHFPLRLLNCLTSASALSF